MRVAEKPAVQTVDATSHSRLTPEAVAAVLSAAGGTEIGADEIRETLAEGAPANADGSIDLFRYLAWVVSDA